MRRIAVIVICAVLAGTAGGQETTSAPAVDGAPASAALLTVDVDRLFSQSAFGERIVAEYTEGRAVLFEENQTIAAELRTEELALAAQRAEMDVAVFRREAVAFDEKAQGIRSTQDAKARALEDLMANGREQFLDVTEPILGQLMVDTGAVAILDRRSVLLSRGSIDVTVVAVERIDAAIGDGADLILDTPSPASNPGSEPEPDAQD